MGVGNYTIYHLHSFLSNGVTNIDSVTDYHRYVERASECGMTALGFSEHGSVFSWLNKKKAIEAAGMKYIHGEEFYVTESLDEKVRDNYHCVLIAKNYDGVLELNRLSSKAFNRDDNHFYFNPRISFDELLQTSDNIIITTACLGSILNSGIADLERDFCEFLKVNSHRCFLEIQHHNVQDQIDYNRKMYMLHVKTGVPLIAGTDTHALNDEHMAARAVMQKSKNVRFEHEEEWDMTFKTYDELVAAYEKQDSIPMQIVLEAIENTNVLADMVEPFNVDTSYKYPHLWENPERTLIDKVNAGIERRGIKAYPNYKDYINRANEEYKTYKHNGAIDFILLMEDVVNYCREHNINIGWGRGSVTGSIICWLLGITEMDSIKYGLNFERFMNVERVSLADIDTDFPPSRREEVKQYIFSHHGLYCSDIITFNTVALKGAVRDVCRGLYARDKNDKEYLRRADYICNNVEADERKMRDEFPEVFKYVDIIQGTIVSIGSHPCGLICSPQPIDGTVGLCTTSTDTYPVSQLYMKEVDALNYVKLDLLALDTIELISNTCELAGIPMLNPDTLDVSDDAVWNSMRDDTTAIFQWEGGAGQDYIKKILSDKTIARLKRAAPNLDKMTLLSIGNSAIRPAGDSYRDDLGDGIVVKTGSPAIDDFLSNTFGRLVYQEQIILFLHKFCGYSMGEADVVRRGFAKKTGTEQHIPRIKEGFIKTMTEQYGMSVAQAEHDIVAFLKVIEDASSYLFSLNHSQPYSFEGYASAWLRYYYPLEFITAALNINKDKEEKTKDLIKYAKSVGISIRTPRFRHSRSEYFFDKEENIIYKGIESIKFMNGAVGEELQSLKDEQFDSFIDLLLKLSVLSINSKQLDMLIKIDFFTEFGNIAKLLNLVKIFSRLYDTTNKRFKKQLRKEAAKEIGVNEEVFEKYSHKVTEKTYMQLDCYGLLKDVECNGDFEDIDTLDKAQYQQQILGDVSIVDNKLKNYACVSSVDAKYSPKVMCYALANGNTLLAKIPKHKFTTRPLHEGDIIYVEATQYKPQQELNRDTGKWRNVPGSKVLWINDYKIVRACA